MDTQELLHTLKILHEKNGLDASAYHRRETSSSSPSSDGNASLLDEGGSASQVPQATVELAGYGSVIWPDSLSEWLVDGAELQ